MIQPSAEYAQEPDENTCRNEIGASNGKHQHVCLSTDAEHALVLVHTMHGHFRLGNTSSLLSLYHLSTVFIGHLKIKKTATAVPKEYMILMAAELLCPILTL